MRQFARTLNISWFLGVFCFHILLALSFLLKRIKVTFQVKDALLLTAVVLAAVLAGMAAASYIKMKCKNEKTINTLFFIIIFTYAVTLPGAGLHLSHTLMVVCASVAAVNIGYTAIFINSVIADALRLDRYAGRTIALALLFCSALVAITIKTDHAALAVVASFVLLIYFYCRPPIRYLSMRKRVLRSDMQLVSDRRTVINYIILLALIGIRYGAELCLVLPIYSAESIITSIFPLIVFSGVGAIVAGIVWDKTKYYLPMIAFCCVCLTLVNDAVFGVVVSAPFASAVNSMAFGGIVLYITCSGIVFPVRKGFVTHVVNIGAASVTFGVAAGIAVLSMIITIPGGRMFVYTLRTFSLVVILIQLFYDSIYQNIQQADVPFELKLEQFKTSISLTAREAEVVNAVLTSEKNLKDLAAELFISPSTLEKHMTNIYIKANVKNRAELTQKFFSEEKMA